MNTKKTENLNVDELRRALRLKNFIIRTQLVVIIFALVVGIVLPLTIKLIKRSKIPARLSPIDKTVADPTIESYRNNFAYQRLSLSLAPKVKAIVHEFGDFQIYSDFFVKFKTNHATVGTDYEWEVGFYPALYSVDGHPRLSIYVIPTMVNKGTGDVKDYFTYKDSDYYFKKKDGTTETEDYIYDQGTIFP